MLQFLKLFTDERGKLSSTRLAALWLVLLLSGVIISDVWFAVGAGTVIYSTLSTVIVGLVGVVGVRSGFQTFSERKYSHQPDDRYKEE